MLSNVNRQPNNCFAQATAFHIMMLSRDGAPQPVVDVVRLPVGHNTHLYIYAYMYIYIMIVAALA